MIFLCHSTKHVKRGGIPIVLLDVTVVTLVVTFLEVELLGVKGGGEMMLPLVVVEVEEILVLAPEAPPSP